MAITTETKCDAYELGIEKHCPGIMGHCKRGEHCHSTSASCNAGMTYDPCIICCFCKEGRQ